MRSERTTGHDAHGTIWVPAVHVVEETPVPPERVPEAACDFSERRAELWPDVHLEHFDVHDLGDTFAEVTEGNPEPIGFVWERLRYDWSRPGSIKATVTDSNIFRPGSRWEIRGTPHNGCHVQRHPGQPILDLAFVQAGSGRRNGGNGPA